MLMFLGFRGSLLLVPPERDVEGVGGDQQGEEPRVEAQGVEGADPLQAREVR